jgi:hypothetical protein
MLISNPSVGCNHTIGYYIQETVLTAIWLMCMQDCSYQLVPFSFVCLPIAALICKHGLTLCTILLSADRCCCQLIPIAVQAWFKCFTFMQMTTMLLPAIGIVPPLYSISSTSFVHVVFDVLVAVSEQVCA